MTGACRYINMQYFTKELTGNENLKIKEYSKGKIWVDSIKDMEERRMIYKLTE